MILVKCQACGKRYDYHENGCCPECGAYNRPPRRNRVGADGVVHHMNDTDFLQNNNKNHSARNGKVCFEQKQCFEDEARKVYNSAQKWAKAAGNSFAHGTQSKGKQQKSGPAKIITIVVIVILVTNVLPLMLTMCSVSGVFEDIIDELFSSEVSWDRPTEIPLSPAIPDLSGAELIDFGQSFLWGDEMACVTEANTNEEEHLTKMDLTVRVLDPFNKPEVHYLLPDGTLIVAECTAVNRVADGEYTYYFDLFDRQPGSACYALFTGQTDGAWCMYELPLC